MYSLSAIFKAVLFFFCIFLCGCAYTTQTYFLPAGIQTVHIATFENKTDQPNIENELRLKIISAFQNDGNLKIVPLSEADAVLTGTVKDYSRQPLRYINNESVREYRLQIGVDFEFNALLENKIIVKENNFFGDSSFYLTGDSVAAERQARCSALDDLASRVLNRIVTLW